MQHRIKLRPEEVKDFVSAATKCIFDVDISYNRFIVDVILEAERQHLLLQTAVMPFSDRDGLMKDGKQLLIFHLLIGVLNGLLQSSKIVGFERNRQNIQK